MVVRPSVPALFCRSSALARLKWRLAPQHILKYIRWATFLSDQFRFQCQAESRSSVLSALFFFLETPGDTSRLLKCFSGPAGCGKRLLWAQKFFWIAERPISKTRGLFEKGTDVEALARSRSNSIRYRSDYPRLRALARP
jgi:hypothetical protein